MDALEQDTGSRKSFNEVLCEELSVLRRGLKLPQPLPADAKNNERGANLHELFKIVGKFSDAEAGSEPLSALCLSGGGIRSATFNLGVIQRLAKIKVLGRIDYLSSVSGGGYVAGWLRAWMRREGVGRVVDKLAGSVNDGVREERGPVSGAQSIVQDTDIGALVSGGDSLANEDSIRDAQEVAVQGEAATLNSQTKPAKLGQRSWRNPLRPEPKPVAKLREYSNYLTPQLGLFSGDTWAAVAIVVRNLLLNWLVLLPCVAAALAIPLVFLLVVRGNSAPSEYWQRGLYISLGVETVASLLVHFARRFVKGPGASQWTFIWMCVIPIWAAASSLAIAALLLPPDFGAGRAGHQWPLWIFAAAWCIGAPLVGWGITELCVAVVTTLLPEVENDKELKRGKRDFCREICGR